MRLTLRTLLAYLDEILEPGAAQEIGKKVEESEVAGGLLHRIRDVMRRLRLKAPEIDEQDTALDPNTVAEYLDNTLPDDRVPDFEKVCLESDMHLAEVASCHQVLAMVLGEPAEIDPKSREHMYTLRQVSAEQNEMKAAAHGYDDDASSQKPSHKQRPRPEIPEYLRERPKRRRRLPMAIVLAAAGCLAAVLLAATGWLGFLGINPSLDPPLADKQLAAKQPADDIEQPTVVPAVKQPDEQPIAPPPVPPPVPPGQTPDRIIQPPPPADAVAEKQPKPDKPAAVPAAVPAAAPAAAPVAAPAVAPAAVPVAAPAAAPVPPERIGRFISDNNVLLRLAAGKTNWTRVPAQDILTPQYELLSLPTFRPIINTTAGLTLRLVDGTRIAFEPPDAEGVLGLKIAYGRVIVQTLGKDRLALKLGTSEVGQKSGLLAFGDAESTLMIEVIHELGTGRNPEGQSSRVKAVLYVVTGQVQWAEEGTEPVEIDASQMLTLGGTATEKPAVDEPVAMEASPDWIIADSVSLIDQKASATVEADLSIERPVSLGLKELADHRKKEVRRLAIRCLGHIGSFDQMAAVLNDPGQRLTRPDYINDLRASLARGPRVAAHVRQAFERQYGPDAPALVRLLWGFTDEQLAANDKLLGSGNADEMLVDYLDHQLLAFRVLGFWNLQAITGLGLYYQPEQIVNKRQQSIRNWRQRLKSGEIRHRNEPPAVKKKNSGG